jgi:hypothetical protein
MSKCIVTRNSICLYHNAKYLGSLTCNAADPYFSHAVMNQQNANPKRQKTVNQHESNITS